METYKCSKYNILIEETDSGVTLWNSYNGSIIQLEKEIYTEIIKGNINNKFKNFNELLNNGFIVSEFSNEYEVIKEAEKNIINKANEHLSIVIAPSLKCNFKCVYCFELQKEKEIIMNLSTVDKIVKFIFGCCIESKIKTLSITWFGGEPMLCYDLILNFSKKLKALTNTLSINFYTRIITNGSLLSIERVLNLKENANLKFLQITLDGTEKIYTKKKGTNSKIYNKVINNICDLCSYVNIRIRLNADRSNYQDLMQLAIFLLEKKELKGKIDIYFAELKNYNNDNINKYFNIYESTLVRYNFYNELYKKGLIKKRKTTPINFDPLFCGFKMKNNIVIGPNGEFYKCEHHIGDKNKVVGSVDKGFVENTKLNHFYNGEYDKRCELCNLYPVCRYCSCPVMYQMVNSDTCNIYNDLLQSIIFQCKQYIKENYSF